MVYLIEWMFLISTSVGVIIYLWLVSNFNFWKKRGVIGPKPKPLYGNIPSLLSASNHMSYDLDRIYKQYKGAEPFIGFFISRQPRLLILDPKLVRDILITNFQGFQDNDIMRPVNPNVDKLLAQNPFFVRGAEWKEKRAEITPALTSSRIKANYPIMTEVCKKLSKFIESELENSPQNGVDGKDLADRYTVEVVSSAIYGIEAGAFSKGQCQIKKVGSEALGNNTMFNIVYLLMVSSFRSLEQFYYHPLISKKTENFFINLMHDAIKLRQKNKDDRIDFLNFLLHLQEKKNLSVFDMAAHTLTFFIDGFETSSILISSVIYTLAKHKDVQEKLRKEIRGCLSKDGSLPFEKLNDLSYLDCVINETLRLFPVGPYVSKMCTEPTVFTNFKGKHIPIEKDVVAVIPIYSIHRDPEYYEKPDEFIPDRFSEENGGAKKYRDMNVFLPFGDGPRICIGMRFALAQSKAMIAELILNWDMTLNKKTNSEFVAYPKNFLFVMDGGVWVDFKKIPTSQKNGELLCN